MRYWFATLSLLWIATLIQAEEMPHIKVASMEWAGYSKADGSGYYIELLQTVFPEDHYRVEMRFVPFARSLQFAASGQADMALGLYFDDSRQVLFSRLPVAMDVIDAATTTELHNQWRGIESLSEKKVGAYIGYRLKNHLPKRTHLQRFTSLKAMLKMVAIGRLDAVLDYEKDMSPLIYRINADIPIIKQVITIPLYFGFTPDDKGRQLKATFDQAYNDMLQQGNIKVLIDKHIADAAPHYPFQCQSGQCTPLGALE